MANSSEKIKSEQESFLQKNKWWIIGSTLTLIFGYGIIYLCFFSNGVIPTGVDLDKKDWLSFLGAYLSFAGTVGVSLIAILQSRFFVERDKERSSLDRKKQIQPIFSVSILAKDSQVLGTAEVFNINKAETYPQHKNVTIEIENVGGFPVRNVIVFDKYLYQLLKPNEKKQIQVAYSDSPDIQKWKDHIIEIFETDYERSSSGVPKWFNINYDDIDGVEMFQSFRLMNFDATEYYSLEEITEI